jgi:hypothetical protein
LRRPEGERARSSLPQSSISLPPVVRYLRWCQVNSEGYLRWCQVNSEGG